MSGIRSIRRGPTAVGSATATSAPIYVDSDDNRVKVIPGGTGSAEVILQETSGSGSAEAVITTKAITAAESGKTYFLDLAAGFVTTLPAVALGLRYSFVVKTAPTGGSYTIVCPAAAALFKGHVLSNDLNAASDSDFGTAGEATVTIVVNKAVAGDRVHVISDGTNWHVAAECSVFDAITIS